MSSHRRVFLGILAFLVIGLLVFLTLEVGSRVALGERLVFEFEESGLYYPVENQMGWYTHRLNVPLARINNFGLRGNDVENISLSDYHFFGDSFTFGWLLADDETFSSLFEEYGGGRALNFGQGGYGFDHMVLTYEKFSDGFSEGDTLIVVLIEDDFYRPLVPFQSTFKNKLGWFVKEHSSFLSFVLINARQIMNKGNSVEKVYSDTIFSYEEKLLDFAKDVESKDLNLVYVFYEFEESEFSLDAREFCLRVGLACMTDVYDSFEGIPGEELYAADGGHPSVAANRAFVNDLVGFIEPQSF